MTTTDNGAAFRQRDRGMMTYPQEGWRRFMFKAPITLWRMGLGPLLGRYLVLITQTGRVSGLPRRTMAEYHRVDGQIVVPCAFGERAQWYKNIQADPHVTLQTASGVQAAKARRVTDDDELRRVYDVLSRRNPVMLNWYLESLGVAPDVDDVIAKKDRLIFLAFDPTDVPTPPPLEADLTWVWSVLAQVITTWLVRRWRRRRQKNEDREDPDPR